MTLVSQFFNMKEHIAFYLFAILSVVLLPVLTAIYSNTSGRRGSGLLRAGYVLTDPILSSITVTPFLILNKLPELLKDLSCLQKFNETVCLINSSISELDIKIDDGVMLNKKKKHLILIQASIVLPALLIFSLGRRTRKMYLTTFLLSFGYWFIVTLETASLLDSHVELITDKHTIITTSTIIVITQILTNSYAAVTLCSYLTPTDNHSTNYDKFNIVFRSLVAIFGICFCEIPLIVARMKIILGENGSTLNGSFYAWFIKNFMTIVCIVCASVGSKFAGDKIKNMSCTVNWDEFDSSKVYFEPEKRDSYIVKIKKETLREKSTVVQTDYPDNNATKIDNDIKDNRKKVTFDLEPKTY